MSLAEHASCALENETRFIPGSSLSSCLPSVLIDIPGLSPKGTVFHPGPLSELARANAVMSAFSVSSRTVHGTKE